MFGWGDGMGSHVCGRVRIFAGLMNRVSALQARADLPGDDESIAAQWDLGQGR